MVSFFVAVTLLIIGYLIYGKFIEGIFSPDHRKTPAILMADGVDYVTMPKWRSFLVQLLNIAGTGPIFGAIMGAVFGPVVFLWIVFGSILGGAVHDYMTGMISIRNKGTSIPELTGKYLGTPVKYIMRVFAVVLLVLVGTVFVTSPAALLALLTPNTLNTGFWVIIILCYYILATLLPIDKVIGRLYPIFGITLILMALGIILGVFLWGGYTIPEVSLVNRLILTIPLLGVGAILTQLDFDVLWRYFSWSNQTLAMIALWSATGYLLKNNKGLKSLVTALPASFMTAVSITYILIAKEGFHLSQAFSYTAGICFAIGGFLFYTVILIKTLKKTA